LLASKSRPRHAIKTGLALICLALAFLLFRAEPSLPAHAALNIQYCSVSGVLSLSEAKQCDYVSYKDLTRTTQQRSVIWARLEVQKTNEPPLPITIYVLPNLVKAIDVFEGKTEQLLAGPVGMNYPYSDTYARPGGYSFTVFPNADHSDSYYVRMVTGGVSYAFITATTADQADKLWSHQQLGLGAHVGLLGLLFLVSACIYLLTSDQIAGRFAVVVLNLLLATLAGAGYLFEHWWPDWPRFNAFFFTTMLYLRVGLWVWLAQAFLMTYQPPNWYRNACRGSYWLVLVMVLLSLIGYDHVSNWLLLILGVTLVPLLQILAAKGTPDMRSLYRRLLMFGFAAGALLVWVTLLITLFPTNDPSTSISFARLVDYVNPIILLSLVVFHYRETSRQLVETKKDNLKIRLGLEFEQKVRQERTLLIDMLTHEIRNPLTSISLAVASITNMLKKDQSAIKRRIENIDESVRGMDMILERCNLMNRLDQNTFSIKPELFEVRETVQNILQRFPQANRVLTDFGATQRLRSDPHFFQMIISNLVENALKYSPTDSQVHLRVRCSTIPNTLHIMISNKIGAHGSPEAGKAFQRYYRNPLAQDTTGSGIGLYLVEQLTKRLGGTIVYQASLTDVQFNVEIPGMNTDA
jgi:signal transduction histidine kinase